MTSTTPMTREELLELAALDALGLLDEYETALYTRSFHHAPAAVQDEVKTLQAAYASEAGLLPDVEPSPELRRQVIDSVAAAIEAESVELAPLAIIGRAREIRDRQAVRGGLNLSGQIWRAAAFVLAGALLVSAYFALSLKQDHTLLFRAAIDSNTLTQIHRLAGSDFSTFANDPNCVRVALHSVGIGRGEYAVLYVREQRDEAFILALNLPGRGTYELSAKDADGRVQFAQAFENRGATCGMHITGVSAAMLANVSWEITSVSTGATVLRSA